MSEEFYPAIDYDLLPEGFDPETWEGYFEITGTSAPGESGFSPDGGKSTMQFLVEDSRAGEFVLDVLGDTEYECGANGKVQRRMPMAHPRWPFHYGSRVAWMRGLGKAPLEETDAAWYDAPPPEWFGRYKWFRALVEFTPRPFAVRSDDSVGSESVTYFDDEGSAYVTTVPKEWERFVQIEDGGGAVDVVTAQYGQAKLRAGGNPNLDRQLQYMPSVRLPRNALILTWYGVPARYTLSPDSWIRKCLGHVNSSEFLGYPAGWLRLDSYASKAYQPAIPGYELEAGGYRVEMMCDIKLTMAVAPRNAKARIVPTRGGMPIDGWNTAVNYADLGSYYVSTDVTPFGPDNKPTGPDSAEGGVSMHMGREFRLLFRDPDYVPEE